VGLAQKGAMSITVSLAHQNLESESTSGLTHPLQSGTSFPATSSSPAVHELHTLQPKLRELLDCCPHEWATTGGNHLLRNKYRYETSIMPGCSQKSCKNPPARLVPAIDGAVRVPDINLTHVLAPEH
jgi:hypothetical protein